LQELCGKFMRGKGLAETHFNYNAECRRKGEERAHEIIKRNIAAENGVTQARCTAGCDRQKQTTRWRTRHSIKCIFLRMKGKTTMSEARQSSSKIPQILDKQAPGHGNTDAGRHERHRRDREAAEADVQGVFADQGTPKTAPKPDIFTREELQTLLADSTRICVSIHMRTHPAGEIAQNLTEFKNLFREAEKQLAALGMESGEAMELMIPVQELMEHLPFWKSAGAGLAVFRSPELFRVYRIPEPLENLALVNDHFQIQPLLPLLNGNGRFYLLTLSQDDIHLWRGTHEKLEEVELEGVPRNMAEALNEEPERHAFNRNNAFGAGQPFHGHSQAPEDTNDRLNRFFHMIDKGLHKYLRNETSPLVLVGVEYHFPLYRGANTYAHLMDEGIHGSPQQMTPQELHDRAWELVQPVFLQAQEDAVNRYNDTKATPNLLSQSLEEIVSAAAFGRVDTLFTQIGAHRYGIFDAANNLVYCHDDKETGDDDLINFAAMQTLLHSGVVYPLPPESMPDNAEIAALYRF
jgi:hypothetical protein